MGLRSYDDLVDGPVEDETGEQGARSYKNTLLGKGILEEESTDEEDSLFQNQGLEDESDDEDDNGVQMVDEEVEGGRLCPILRLSKEEETRIRRPWKNCLIITLMGRRVGFRFLEKKLMQMWRGIGVFEIVDLGYDYYLVRFSSMVDRDYVLTGGPWMIFDHYLVVQEWRPNFNPASASVDKVAVWVRFPELAMEYYDRKCLKAIGNRIGKTVKVDFMTEQKARGKYARVCVLVDLNKPLLPQFRIGNTDIKIEYEGMHLICFNCGVYGHYTDGCPKHNKQPQIPLDKSGEDFGGRAEMEEQVMADSNVNQAGKADKLEMEYGDWMVVQKPKRGRKGKNLEQKQDAKSGRKKNVDFQIGNNSRFAALSNSACEEEKIREETTKEVQNNNAFTYNKVASGMGQKESYLNERHAQKGNQMKFLQKEIRRSGEGGRETNQRGELEVNQKGDLEARVSQNTFVQTQGHSSRIERGSEDVRKHSENTTDCNQDHNMEDAEEDGTDFRVEREIVANAKPPDPPDITTINEEFQNKENSDFNFVETNDSQQKEISDAFVVPSSCPSEMQVDQI